MENSLSRSEQKRRAKAVENLAQELVALSAADIKKLPCQAFILNEIVAAKTLKGGARKRQVKYIAKELRAMDTEPLLNFLEERKGSQLKKKQEFRAIEQLRDSIITEVLSLLGDAEKQGIRLDEKWHSAILERAHNDLPSLDVHGVKKSALQFAVTRKPVFSREIFRMLKAAQERKNFANHKE